MLLVLATQNPIEQEGTYALPEAQLDRFLFKIKVDYPSLEEEIKIIQTHHERKGTQPQQLIKTVITPKQLAEYKQKILEVIVEEKIIRYIAEIIGKTRNHPHLYLGGSPRASLATLNAAKAFAAIDGVLNHRVILTPEREMEGVNTDSVITMIIESVEIPR